jgi:hypothetical protein
MALLLALTVLDVLWLTGYVIALRNAQSLAGPLGRHEFGWARMSQVSRILGGDPG